MNIEHEFAKTEGLLSGDLKLVTVHTKEYYTRNPETKLATVYYDIYHGRGDYGKKFDENSKLGRWQAAANHAIFTAKKSGDIIDQIFADMIAWPIINLNWSQKYTQAERRQAFTMVTGTTYEHLNAWRRRLRRGTWYSPPPIIWSLFHEEMHTSAKLLFKTLSPVHIYIEAFKIVPQQKYVNTTYRPQTHLYYARTKTQ